MAEYIKKEDAIEAITKQIADALRLVTRYYVRPQDVVEEKRGKWFDVGSMSCRCSNCGCKSPKEYSFCPHCGAKMESEGANG